VCKRDGELLTAPHILSGTDEHGLAIWQKLTVYASQSATHEGRSLSVELVRRLRQSQSAGATSLRGIWGFHGDHAPHGDRLLSLRRHVPIVTVVVDTPSRIQRWWRIVDEVTGETGLVTSEIVPASRAGGGASDRGGLRLARHRRHH
jgi:PII-like signaling protein